MVDLDIDWRQMIWLDLEHTRSICMYVVYFVLFYTVFVKDIYVFQGPLTELILPN